MASENSKDALGASSQGHLLGVAKDLFVRPSNSEMMQAVPLRVTWKDSPCTEHDALSQRAETGDVLASIIDFSLLNEIFENFLEVTGLPIAILDLDGKVLASSKWQRLCMSFHRVHRDTLVRCVASDTLLSRQMQEGSDCAIYQCANGLTDCATPIVVDDVHVANLFTGQFLLDTPDMSFFKRQQELHGFDETAYFEALENVPIVAKEKIPAVLKLLRGLAQQITQLSLANCKLHSTTQMLRTIVDTVPHFVFWKDRQSRYLGGNQALIKLAKLSSDQDIVGKTDLDLPWQNFAQRYRQDDAEVMDTGIGKRNIIEPLNMEDGTVRWMETSKVPLVDGQGKTFGVLGLFQDVTERKETEEALSRAKEAAEHANDAKSRFLAAVSHDLRQPLSALSLYIATLEQKLPAAYAPLKTNISDCLSHLNAMLSNLLDLSRLEAGAITPQTQDFDLNEMLQTIASSFMPQARDRFLDLRVRKSRKIGSSDPALLQRIVANLVANAVRYTEKGGVLIGTRRREGKIWIEVWDTGIGIPQNQTQEIFEEFRQLGNDERNFEKGTGLGLAIVAKTAALLGLGLRMSSRIGKGSVFAVELPVGESPPARSEQASPLQCLKVALVEDNEQVGTALAYALNQVGHSVTVATSRSQLLSRLNGAVPDLVISDYRLAGDEDGLAIIHSLRNHFGQNLPALVITGDTAPDVIRRFAKAGIAVQHKPLDLKSLLATMTSIVRGEDAPAPAQ